MRIRSAVGFTLIEVLIVVTIIGALIALTAPGLLRARIAAIAPYKGRDSDFTAMGDEYGLVLLMKRGRVIDFTGNADNGVRVYCTGINLRGSNAAKHQLASHPYHLTIEERCSCG